MEERVKEGQGMGKRVGLLLGRFKMTVERLRQDGICDEGDPRLLGIVKWRELGFVRGMDC